MADGKQSVSSEQQDRIMRALADLADLDNAESDEVVNWPHVRTLDAAASRAYFAEVVPRHRTAWVNSDDYHQGAALYVQRNHPVIAEELAQSLGCAVRTRDILDRHYDLLHNADSEEDFYAYNTLLLHLEYDD